MIEAVIFDVDGTLVDSVDLHARAWQEALRHFQHLIPFATIRSQIGKGGDQLLPVFLSPTELRDYGTELEEYRGALFKRKYLPDVRPFPQVRALFERLHEAGQRLVLASSAHFDELEIYARLANIEDLLDDMVSADDAERSKPHPDIFAAALDKLELPAPRAVVVGDTPYDAQAAQKLSLACIGVLSGGFPAADLRSAGCQSIYQSPADLLAHYANSPLARSTNQAVVSA